MKCVILVAGHNVKLENEIIEDTSGKYKHLSGVPKALLPTSTAKTLLDCWYVFRGLVFGGAVQCLNEERLREVRCLPWPMHVGCWHPTATVSVSCIFLLCHCFA